jgi:thioredoxin-related protein
VIAVAGNPSGELLLVTTETCGACKALKKQLGIDEIQATLKERFGTSKYRELKVEADDLATRIVVSLNDYSVPKLVLYRKAGKETVCVIDENLEARECVEVVNFPKE